MELSKLDEVSSNYDVSYSYSARALDSACPSRLDSRSVAHDQGLIAVIFLHAVS